MKRSLFLMLILNLILIENIFADAERLETIYSCFSTKEVNFWEPMYEVHAYINKYAQVEVMIAVSDHLGKKILETVVVQVNKKEKPFIIFSNSKGLVFKINRLEREGSVLLDSPTNPFSDFGMVCFQDSYTEIES